MMNSPDANSLSSPQDSAGSRTSNDHPLAASLGQFEGEFWEATLAEIRRQRQLDRRELESNLSDDEQLTA
jgi:hypothetical protein